MKRSGQRCRCGFLIPYLTCSHCKPQLSYCPHCGTEIVMYYEGPVEAGREILRKVKGR